MPNCRSDMSLFSSNSGVPGTLALSKLFLTCPCYFPKGRTLAATFWRTLGSLVSPWSILFLILPRTRSTDESISLEIAFACIFMCPRMLLALESGSCSPALDKRCTRVINLPPMTDLYDFNRTFSVVNRVENAVIPLPDAIGIFRE